MSEGNGSANGAPTNAGMVGPGRPPVEHRFKPGTSGNPGGMPKGTKHVRKRLRNELIRYLRDHPEKRRAMIAGLVGGCIEGDAACQRIAWDRVDGAVTQAHEVSGAVVIAIQGIDPP